jgi:hypothetical protein
MRRKTDRLGGLIQGSRHSLDAQPVRLVAQSILIGVLPNFRTGSVLNLRARFTVQRLVVGHALLPLLASKKAGPPVPSLRSRRLGDVENCWGQDVPKSRSTE